MKNVLKQFFHDTHCSNKWMDKEGRKELEARFEEWYSEQVEYDFEFAVRPVMKHLGNSTLYSPYHSIIIKVGRAELVDTQKSIVTDEYIAD